MSKNQNIINTTKKWMSITLYFAVVLEMIFFPSWANLCGCLMALVCWWIFQSFFFKRKLILEHPFAFAMFLSMVLYRYLPLVATLVEGKPVTYGFEMPYETFFWEFILYIVSALAFHFACNTHKTQNNIIQKTLYKLGFFNISTKIIWGLGTVGVFACLYLYTQGDIEYGDVTGKFMAGITYLMYAPLCLLFPNLLGIAVSPKHKPIVWIYTTFIFILSFATNSRQAMIAPIATLVLLFFLQLVKDNINVKKLISPVKVITITVLLIFGLSLVSDISLAMLATRSIRDDVSRKELFYETIETYQNKALMQQLRAISIEDKGKLLVYNEGWDETYIDNFILNRYGNMRITDQTLYYAYQGGFGQERMIDHFMDRLWAELPTPLLDVLGTHINKTYLEYSRGDVLYNSGYGGYRVTSHVGDGLATFGYFYFLIQFVLFFLVFKLLDCFVYYTKNGFIIYSAYGLMSVFMFLGLFRNANGCLGEATYCLRGFWQGCITFLIIVTIFKLILPHKKNN